MLIYGKTIEQWESLADNFIYEFIDFKDRIVEEPRAVTEEDIGVDSEGRRIKRQTPAPGKIHQEGTPLSSAVIGKLDIAVYILFKISNTHKQLIEEGKIELADAIEEVTATFNTKVEEMLQILSDHSKDSKENIERLEGLISEVDKLAKSNLDEIVNLMSLIKYENGILTVGKAGDPFSISINNGFIEFNSSNNTPLKITEDLISVAKIEVLESIILGNHIIETFGDETIIRKVS